MSFNANEEKFYLGSVVMWNCGNSYLPHSTYNILGLNVIRRSSTADKNMMNNNRNLPTKTFIVPNNTTAALRVANNSSRRITVQRRKIGSDGAGWFVSPYLDLVKQFIHQHGLHSVRISALQQPTLSMLYVWYVPDLGKPLERGTRVANVRHSAIYVGYKTSRLCTFIELREIYKR